MSPCECACESEALARRQRGTLVAVLGINAVMFGIVMAAALVGASAALLSDSLDSLGDALTYAISLYAVGRGARAKAGAALFKGALIFLGASGVLAQIAVKLVTRSTPSADIMGAFSLLSLAANSLCLFLLWRHRREDVNMSSVWECSRNDIFTNVSIFLTAGAVRLTASPWPDIAVATALMVLLYRSAFRVLRGAWREWIGTSAG